MQSLKALSLIALALACIPGLNHGRVLGRVHTAVGYLPRHLAEETSPTPLSLNILEPATSADEALTKAKALHAALNSDRTKAFNNLFVSWAEAHQEYYSTEEEALEAFDRFVINLEHMVHHNLRAEEHGHWRGLNKWSGRNMFTIKRKFSISGRCKNVSLGAAVAKCQKVGADPPTFAKNQKPIPVVNWRKRGYLTPVKNQGSGCNSAWANAAASAVDAGFAIQYNNTPVSISRQAFVACINDKTLNSTTTNSAGCDYGNSNDVFSFLNVATVTTETKYPYTAQNGSVSACASKYLTLTKNNTDQAPWFKNQCTGKLCGNGGATTYMKGNANFTLFAVGGGLETNGIRWPGQPVVVYWSFLNKSDPAGTGPCSGYDCDFLNYQGGIYTGKWCPSLSTLGPSINHAIFGASWGEQGVIRVNISWYKFGFCGMYTQIFGPSLNFTSGFMPKKPIRFLDGASVGDYCSQKYSSLKTYPFCKTDSQCYNSTAAVNFCPEL